MANSLLTTDVILKEAMVQFENSTPICSNVMRLEDKSYAGNGAREGDTLRVKVPQEFSVRTGMTFTNQDIGENSVTIARSTVKGIDFTLTQKELALDIGEMSRNIISPAIATLASEVEAVGAQIIAEQVNGAVTLPVTAIDRTDIINAGVKLDQFGTPRNQRNLFLSPKAMGQFVDGNASIFNPTSNVSSQYKTGREREAYGFNVHMSQDLHSITRGTANGSYLVAGAGQTGSSLNVDTGTGTFVVGDKITIAGVFALNPLNKRSTGELMQFGITAVSAGGTATLAITPAIVTSGQYQNVDAGPADNAAITVYGTSGVVYPQNFAAARNAILFATAEMETPEVGSGGASSKLSANGISLSLTKQYDINAHATKWRFDILFGWRVIVPRQVVMIPGV